MSLFINFFLYSLLLVTELRAQHISSKFISTHKFGDLSVLQMTKDTHWIFHDSKIEYNLDLTVSEAYYGCVKEVSYTRVIPDPTCEVIKCAYCKGKGVIFTKTVVEEEGKHLEQHLHSPCPVCLGKLKAGKDGCSYYKQQVEVVKFEVPRGCRLGYQVRYPQKGNAVLDHTTPDNLGFSLGDLVLSVGAITDPTKSGLNMTRMGLEINVIMTPTEALEGFTKKYDYFDGKVISIDKSNKTTLPGTELIMRDDVLVYGEEGGRDGLLIRFSLLTIEELKQKLEEEEKQDAAAAAVQGGEPITITSQEDFDAWEAEKKDKRKQFKRDSLITKFLFDIKRRQDENDRRAAESADEDDEDDDKEEEEERDIMEDNNATHSTVN